MTRVVWGIVVAVAVTFVYLWITRPLSASRRGQAGAVAGFRG